MFSLTDDEQVEDVAQDVRCDLLGGIAPGSIRVAMALGDDTVEAQVHGLLTKRGYQLTLAADVRRVAEDRQVGDASAQLDGDVPLGQVAVNLLVVRREATVNGTQSFQARPVDALQGTDPKFEVGVHWILHQHGDVHALQRVGYFLHGERVGCGACANPKDVDTCIQGFFHMLGGSHFGSGEHAGLFLDTLHPRQSFYTYAFESTRLGAWFPDTCTENADALAGQ